MSDAFARSINVRPVPAEQRLGERRRNLRRGDPDLLHPALELKRADARLLRGPEIARDTRAVPAVLMIVDVAHEQDRDRSARLRRERLVQRVGGLRRDDAVEDAVRIGLARLVVDRDDDLPFHVLGRRAFA